MPLCFLSLSHRSLNFPFPLISSYAEKRERSAVTYRLSSVTNLRVLYSILRPKLCTTGSGLSPARMFANCGRKSNVRVAVVEARIKAVIVTKARVARSGIRLASTTTIPDVTTTKYTLIPMYCESFRAGIFTCLKPLARFTRGTVLPPCWLEKPRVEGQPVLTLLAGLRMW